MSAPGGGALLLEHVCSSNKGSLSITDIYLPPNWIPDNATVCGTCKQFVIIVIISAVRIVFFSFRIESNSPAIIWNFESNSYRRSQKSPIVSTC